MPDDQQIFEFGPYEFRLPPGELLKNGVQQSISKQPAEILHELLDNAGHLVIRQQLADRLWPASNQVDFEDRLNHVVRRLREVLRDSAEDPAFIKTESGRGYRFVCPVQTRSLSSSGSRAAEGLHAADAKKSSMLRLAMFGVILVLGVAGAWLYRNHLNDRWVGESALPSLHSLIEHDDYGHAFFVAEEIERKMGVKVVPEETWNKVSAVSGITSSSPPGAAVSYRLYSEPGSDWIPLGTAPLEPMRLPRDTLVLKYEMSGHDTALRVTRNPGNFARNADYDRTWQKQWGDLSALPETVPMHSVGDAKPRMVLVPATNFPIHYFGFSLFKPVEIPAFYMDKYETTNAEFQQFVDADGYEKPIYWQHLEFVDGDQILSWADAMARFTDKTGYPGPAFWELGKYPTGTADQPVRGISWFEASAYAEFRSKSLPTIYHWIRAAMMMKELSEPIAPLLIRQSNFGTDVADVGSFDGLSPYGTFDMGGNVREWVHNPRGSHRVVMGGAFNDPAYFFNRPYSAPPWDRSMETGFRCVSLTRVNPSLASTPLPERDDYPDPQWMSDDEFAGFVAAFRYPSYPLDGRIELDTDNPYGRTRKISLNTGSGAERFEVYVFLPEGIDPPYQGVAYMGGADGFNWSLDMADIIPWHLDQVLSMVLRSGRAVAWPVYYGSYSRYDGLRAMPPEEQTLAWNERYRRWPRELNATLDYLIGNGVFTEAVAWLGLSFGGQQMHSTLYLEPRLKAAILLSGGNLLYRRASAAFVPRLTIPTLMLSGRYDYQMTNARAETYFNTLATPPEHKRLVYFESGHWPLPRNQTIREITDWLDRYLGPVP